MATNSLFRPLSGPSSTSARPVEIEFDGRVLQVQEGVSVAAALLSAGVSRFRTSVVSETPRAPYCMMGVCFECLVEIDGQASRQSCLVTVREGMKINTQRGPRALADGTEAGNE